MPHEIQEVCDEIALVAEQCLIAPLPVQHDLEAVLLRRAEHVVLHEYGRATDRLALRREASLEIAREVFECRCGDVPGEIAMTRDQAAA